MANTEFYEGLMRAGFARDSPHWKCSDGDAVEDFVKSAAVHPALHPTMKEVEDHRQWFVDVDSECEKEKNGTSFFNTKGQEVVMTIIQELLKRGVRQKSIGVITMYLEDRRQILARLRDANLEDIEAVDIRIGSALAAAEAKVHVEASTVDAFQGRQISIIIVHFVSARHVGADHPDPFGHIAKPNRLCVATTRAEQAQFFVGNLTHWRKFLFETKEGYESQFKAIKGLALHVTQAKEVIDWSLARTYKF